MDELKNFQAEGEGCYFLTDYYTGIIMVVHVWSQDGELRTHFSGVEESCSVCRSPKKWACGLLIPQEVVSHDDEDE